MDINQPVLPNAVLTHAAPSPALAPTAGIAPAGGACEQNRSDSATSEQARHEQPPCTAEVIKEINDNLRTWSTNLRFDIDPELQRLVVSVVDAHSGDVLRTVPNEVMLRLAKMMVTLQGQVLSTEA